MEVYGKSDIGKKRVSNQDSFAQKVISKNMAWSIVCDGMGGLNAGEIASRTAVEFIASFFEEKLSDDIDDEQIQSIIYDATILANEKVYDLYKSDPELGKMGTTLVMCVVKDNVVHIMHLGDSRAYVIDKDSISQVSVDHSIVQKMIDSGEITPEEAQNHPQKNIITRALGIDATVSPDYKQVKISEVGKVMLCTDGLTSYLSSMEILDYFKKFKGEEIAGKLIEESNRRGGKDNITVSIIEK